jgi:polysaccharide pyruvyl transferase CsaB
MRNDGTSAYCVGGHEEGSELGGLDLRPGERVLLVGGYGVRNVGDEAILSGLLRTFPAGVDVRVVSRSPSETTEMHGVGAVSPLGALTALARSDVLIVGGGGIFSGHMGAMSGLIPAFGLMARVRKARVAFHGLGVYPSTPWWVRRMIRWLAPQLASFTVRDCVSARTLSSWGVTAQPIPDLSMCMPSAPADRGAEILRSLGLEAGVPTVALCLTATERRIEASLLEAVPRLVAALPQVQFCFVPMSQHPKVSHHNDLLLGRRLQADVPRLAVLEAWHHPSDMLALFSHFTVAVCMRYHSLLFAQRAGAAIVPVPYAEKCESWLEECRVPSVELNGEAVAKRVRQGLEETTRRGEALELAT